MIDASSGSRLSKLLALTLNTGRRQADELIAAGHVAINGKPAGLGARITPLDTITVKGEPLPTQSPAFEYILLNKPVGYICSRREQGATPTIYSLLPKQYHHLKPVGRLDKDSSGIILLTNDGEAAHQLTHPSFRKIKRYEISLNTGLQPLHHQIINDHGIDLPDGKSQLRLERLHDGDDRQWLVTMHQGRNRQIRRTFAALGYTVTRLHRIQFGDYAIAQLASGQTRKVVL